MISLSKHSDTNMTEGSITRHLITFAVPLLIGNIFQQMYSTIDSIIVGNYVGMQALAAIGSVNSIINTLIGFFLGLATGAGVVISQYYGSKDEKNVHEAVHTTIVMTFILCAVFTVIGVLMVPYMLRLMATPDDVFEDASVFLRIYFAGVSGLMIYNMGSGILRAVGDSRRPLYFLVFSVLINTGLDFILVKFCGLGVAGAALSTTIAQCLSAALVLIVLTRSNGAYRIVWKELRMNKEMMGRIWRIGMPAALQQAITAFSNVFVQSYINHFGSACMAGWSSYCKIEQFELLPMQSVALSTTTFVGQNLGANNMKRAKEGTNRALIISFVITAILLVPMLIFARPLIGMFNRDPEVLRYGALFMRLILPFYLICVVFQVYAGTLRGAGDTRATMIFMLSSFVLFRQVYLFVASRLGNSFLPVALAYPVGWVLCSILIFIYYKRGKWENRIEAIRRNLQPEELTRARH